MRSPPKASPSQKSQIRALLERGESITPLEAFSKFNCMCLAERIRDLREDGLKIKTDHEPHRNGGTHARYTLMTEECMG